MCSPSISTAAEGGAKSMDLGIQIRSDLFTGVIGSKSELIRMPRSIDFNGVK